MSGTALDVACDGGQPWHQIDLAAGLDLRDDDRTASRAHGWARVDRPLDTCGRVLPM